jgi:nucleoside-diphosphate-sugar epimerase
MTIAVTGSSGFIGSSLIPFLTTGGHRVVRLIRSPSSLIGYVFSVFDAFRIQISIQKSLV